MGGKRTFECLRCDHRFAVEHDPKQVVERSCPKCGSNSVRPAPVVTSGSAAADPAGGGR